MPAFDFLPRQRDDLQQKLSSSGFQRTSAAFFTWLGVGPYLTSDAIGGTPNYMASIQNSEVVFDYMEPPEGAFSEEIKGVVRERTEQLEKTKEPWASRFDAAGMADILRAHGFDDIEDIGFQQIISRFGRGVQGPATEQAGFYVVHAKHSQASKSHIAGAAPKIG